LLADSPEVAWPHHPWCLKTASMLCRWAVSLAAILAPTI
jgi:hypothetical protein